MAFIRQRTNQDDQTETTGSVNGNRQSDTPSLSSGVGAEIQNSDVFNSPQAQASPQPNQATPTTGFTNLKKYLDVNKQGAQNLGNEMAGKVTDTTNASDAAFNSAATGFKDKVDAGTNIFNPDVVNKAAGAAAANANDPELLKQIGGKYTGPTSFLNSQEAIDAASKARLAATQAAQAQDAGGRSQLLRTTGVGDKVSAGGTELNQFLLQNTDSAIGKVNDASKAVAPKLVDYNARATDLESSVGKAQQTNADTQKAALARLFEAQQGIVTGLGQQTTQQQQAAVAKNAAIQDAITKLQNGSAEGATTLAALGLTAEQINSIIETQKVLKDRGVTSNIGQFYTPGSVGNVGMGDVATTQQQADLQALAKLVGNQVVLNKGQAGTQGTFDLNKALANLEELKRLSNPVVVPPTPVVDPNKPTTPVTTNPTNPTTPVTGGKDDWEAGVKYDATKIPAGFDWQKYIAANADLGAAGIDTEEEAKRHYANYGLSEQRAVAPGDMGPAKPDTTTAQPQTPEQVIQTVTNKATDPTPKYNGPNDWNVAAILNGTLVPENFNWQTYLDNNPDLVSAGLDSELEAKKHYTLYGVKEGRSFGAEPTWKGGQAPVTTFTQLYANDDLKADRKNGVNKEFDINGQKYQIDTGVLNYLFEQIKKQGQYTEKYWSGEGQGNPDSNRIDMAIKMAASGITDIRQLGQRGDKFINKVTGQPILSDFNKMDKDTIGGTYNGKGGTKYIVQFTPEGLPVFFTQGFSTSDIGKISLVLQLASLIPGVGPWAMGLNALLQAHEGNWTGAILSGIGSAAGFGSGALKGIQAAQAAGDLAKVAEITSSISGTLASNLGLIKTAGAVIGGIDAVSKGNILGALGSLANIASLNGVGNNLGQIAGTTLTAKDINSALGIAAGLANNDPGKIIASAGQLLGSPNAVIAGQALNLIKALEAGNVVGATKAAMDLSTTLNSAIRPASV